MDEQQLEGPISDLLMLAQLRAADQEVSRKTQARLDMLSAASFEGILVPINGVVIDVNQRLAEMTRVSAGLERSNE